MRGKVAKSVALVTLLGFTVGVSGCYGGFNLTRSLYKWNGNIKVGASKTTNKVAQSVTMVVLAVIPVYGFAMLADALLVNSIEFWTGKNPVTVDAEPAIRAVHRGDDRYVQTFTRTASGKAMRIDHYTKGRYMSTLIVRQDESDPTVTGELRWRTGRSEAYQVTYAGDETYLVGHTNAAGEHREWIAAPDQVVRVSGLVRAVLASPAFGTASSSALLFQ